VKIDPSFSNNIAADVSWLNIVRAVAALANSLEVALEQKGVGKREQFDLIRPEGCTKMPG
jgi:EAL domain-containing protein (putative c-di-GMP-specific phosphodiesterase class I)